ncbi:unnamed protein product [Periconia digitata]|uniref:Uncharacterized protein n=1 Tax=Periconia digitata TaxID=1303443 RepID=A0A9W4XKR3_9PLEO|nr:unnamed protein product [Periconia digitata]
MSRGTSRLAADVDPRLLSDASSKVQSMVMVFGSKPRKLRHKYTKTTTAARSKKTFAFVNISRPGEADEESRRLVKTHVMEDFLRRKRDDCSTVEIKCAYTLRPTQNSTQSVISSPQAPPSHLLTFPIPIEPYMLRLIHQYAGAMRPTENECLDSAWFPMVMTDAALFHALLCTSAVAAFYDMGVQRKHMLECIGLINHRLPGEDATSDATITAILFLAKAEYLQGNHGAWSVHMGGIKTIVELRGGIETLPQLIQEKIYSTDLLGCMEIGIIPHFPISSHQSPQPNFTRTICG